MASSKAARTQAVINALNSLDLKQLDSAATSLGATKDTQQARQLLADLDQARRADDPQTAISAIMEGLGPADVDRMTAVVARLATATLPVTPPDASPTGVVFTEQSRAELQRIGRAVQARTADPAMADILKRSLAVLDPDGPLAHAAAGADQLQQAKDALSSVATALSADPQAPVDTQALQKTLGDLAGQRAQLDAAKQDLEKIQSILTDMSRLADRGGKPAAVARLAVAQADLLERMAAPPAQIDGALARALDRSLDAVLGGDPGTAAAEARLLTARMIGRRVQTRAMAGGDLRAVVAVADRVARAASAASVSEVQIGSLAEGAVALAQLATSQVDATRVRDRLQQALDLARASGRSVLVAQATLAQGQALEHLGEVADARKAFRRVMRMAAEDPSFPYELGWAALHLGRLQAQEGQARKGRRDLDLASAIGAKAHDWLLYGLACRARFDLAMQEEDSTQARQILDSLQTEGTAVGGTMALALHQELGARLAS